MSDQVIKIAALEFSKLNKEIDEKDSEIERLKAERETDCEIMRKTVSALTKACKGKDKLIRALADALHSERSFLLGKELADEDPLVLEARRVTRADMGIPISDKSHDHSSCRSYP